MLCTHVPGELIMSYFTEWCCPDCGEVWVLDYIADSQGTTLYGYDGDFMPAHALNEVKDEVIPTSVFALRDSHGRFMWLGFEKYKVPKPQSVFLVPLVMV